MKIIFKFFEKWTTLFRPPILIILLLIATSFVENRELPEFFRKKLRQIRIKLKSDETIYPAILYRYLPTEFPVEVAANRYAAVPRIVQFIAQIRMTPFSRDNDNLLMSPGEFWQVIERQLPEMREQAAAVIENQNREIELFFQQPLLGTPRIKRLLADFCDEFANALNRTVTNGEVFRSLRADIDAYRNGHFDPNSEQSMQCARVKYLSTIMLWCENEPDRRVIGARLDDQNQYLRKITKLFLPRRKNMESHAKRFLSRIDSHFWSNLNSPNVALLGKFLFNLQMAPARVTNAQDFTQMILREFARQQVKNQNASFVIGQPHAGPPFSRYYQLTVPIAQSISNLITEMGIETRVEDGLTLAKYSDIFESLRNDYWRYENAQDENARNQMVPDLEQHTLRRSLGCRIIQAKAALTIMNYLTGFDRMGNIIDEEYLKRQIDDSDDIDAEENANLGQEQAENVILLIPVQYAQQPQQQQLYPQPQQHLYQQQQELYHQQPLYQSEQQYQLYQQPQQQQLYQSEQQYQLYQQPQQQPLYQSEQQHQLYQQPQQQDQLYQQPQEQHQLYQQPQQQHQLSQPQEQYHQQQLYEQQPQQQQQPQPSTSVRRSVSPDILAQAMILGLISPSSAHSSNMAADDDNARKYLKTNPPQYPYQYTPENVEDEFDFESILDFLEKHANKS